MQWLFCRDRQLTTKCVILPWIVRELHLQILQWIRDYWVKQTVDAYRNKEPALFGGIKGLNTDLYLFILCTFI